MKKATLLVHATHNNDTTPGPGAYTPTLSFKEKSPAFSMKSRHESIERPIAAPYRSLPSSIGSGPKISLASRHSTRENIDTPGPNYVPPPLGSDAKKITMSYRYNQNKDLEADNPGPGAYSIPPSFAKEAVKFSLHGRTNDVVNNVSESPGPAAYTPNYKVSKKSAPAPTFHTRTFTSDNFVTPGPSQYNVSRDLGGTKPSFHIRPQSNITQTSPGPGQYSPTNVTFSKPPAFTMKGRHESVNRPISAPYRTLPSSIGQGPKISLASRHIVKESENTPGPSYVPPAFGSDAPKNTFSFRQNAGRNPHTDEPGPGAYKIEPVFARNAPKSTLHGRTTDTFTQNNHSPGPAAYTPNFSATKPRAPSATMHIRTKTLLPESTPGFVDLGSTLKGPKFSIGRKDPTDVIPI